MRVNVTIIERRTSTFDIGDLPIKMVKSLLIAGNGSFDGNYTTGDVDRTEKYTVDSVEIEPVGKGTKS
jgi:hypothetical protein